MKIKNIDAFQVLDSRGQPTVCASVFLENGLTALALVPSGASTGRYEAWELRDNDPERFLGKGVLKAITNIKEKITPALKGYPITDQTKIDQVMINLDGTDNKKSLGANAILAVSMACARLGAKATQKPLWQYLGQLAGIQSKKVLLPLPMVNIFEGGEHALRSTDIQEYLILPIGATNFPEALRWCAEIFTHLGQILHDQGLQTTVGFEGGYAASSKSNQAPLELILAAIKKAQLVPGKDIALGIDAAASEFYQDGKYHLKTDHQVLSAAELAAVYKKWLQKYPLFSLEDHFSEDDWESFAHFNQEFGNKVQNIGDDLYVTNLNRFQRGIKEKTTNAILIKPNQIGTVMETIATVKIAKQAKMATIVSHRGGDTEDTFIADLAVGLQTGQIKTGSCSRSERVAKYNRLLEIEHQNQGQSTLARFPFRKT
ncbi:phosphopyruvate hydratase [Patescibacteria group bacterium]